MPKKPWYGEGLRFECTECGDCCTGEAGYVWVTEEEIEALAQAVGVEVDRFREHYLRRLAGGTSLVEFANGDCVLFDRSTRRCKAYEARPRQCRTWPFWESNVRTRQAWRQTRGACPGCGHGPLVPLEQIEALVKVVKV